MQRSTKFTTLSQLTFGLSLARTTTRIPICGVFLRNDQSLLRLVELIEDWRE